MVASYQFSKHGSKPHHHCDYYGLDGHSEPSRRRKQKGILPKRLNSKNTTINHVPHIVTSSLEKFIVITSFSEKSTDAFSFTLEKFHHLLALILSGNVTPLISAASIFSCPMSFLFLDSWVIQVPQII